MRKLTLLLGSLLLGTCLATSALAADEVKTAMRGIAENYGLVMKATDAEQMRAGLTGMYEAATMARGAVPSMLEGQPADSPERQTFVQGIGELMDRIQAVIALVDAGKLDEAKLAADKLKEVRSQYHSHFEVF